jgi:hypothetical protein
MFHAVVNSVFRYVAGPLGVTDEADERLTGVICWMDMCATPGPLAMTSMWQAVQPRTTG